MKISEEHMKQIKADLKTLHKDCNMALSGEWDVSTKEGLEAFNDTIEVIERIAENLDIQL